MVAVVVLDVDVRPGVLTKLVSGCFATRKLEIENKANLKHLMAFVRMQPKVDHQLAVLAAIAATNATPMDGGKAARLAPCLFTLSG